MGSSSEPFKIGKYTLLEELGKGGFGTVYRAKDSIDRVVAIKILAPYWGNDPVTIKRFRQEARFGGRLFHQRIATILDYEEVDGYLLLVMRYIDGPSLASLIKRDRKLKLDKALKILAEIAEGLDYAHEHGLIHRDIKPANILVSPLEGAVISDFGLVKMAGGDASWTGSEIIGTPAYMSPEQFLSEKPDYRSDIYALGVVFFEMLTGVRPFTASTPGNLMKLHLEDPVPLLREFNDSLPTGLEKVMRKVLAKNPDNRYQSASDFSCAVLEVVSPKSVVVTRKIVRQEPYRVLATSQTPALVIYLIDTSASMSMALGGQRRLDVVIDALNRSFAQMVFRSTKGARVVPRYRIAMFGYDDRVEDLLGGVVTIDSLVKKGVPSINLGIETNTAEGFRQVEKLLLREVDINPGYPAPVICHLTDGMFTGEDPEPIVKRILQLRVPDGHVLVSNIFISNELENLIIEDPKTWQGISTHTRLFSGGYLDKLRGISSKIPPSYLETMRENGYHLSKEATMLFPADDPGMVVMGFQMAAATPVRGG